VADFALPPSNEPFDFRRQAARYGTFRRDYSPALYDAIAACTGPADGRRALDLGCGTGFVAASLGRRGWRVVGVDFSAPMLAAADARGTALVRARAEALPLRTASVALVTSGTAFHWFQPAPALAEIARVLEPGGHVALFWRYAAPGSAPQQVVADALRAVRPEMPAALDDFTVHAPEPFAGTTLEPLPPQRIDATLAWTPAGFHGYVSTVEWLRRMAGDRHAEFLDRVAADVTRRWPDGFVEPQHEYLFLARRPPA